MLILHKWWRRLAWIDQMSGAAIGFLKNPMDLNHTLYTRCSHERAPFKTVLFSLPPTEIWTVPQSANTISKTDAVERQWCLPRHLPKGTWTIPAGFIQGTSKPESWGNAYLRTSCSSVWERGKERKDGVSDPLASLPFIFCNLPPKSSLAAFPRFPIKKGVIGMIGRSSKWGMKRSQFRYTPNHLVLCSFQEHHAFAFAIFRNYVRSSHIGCVGCSISSKSGCYLRRIKARNMS